MSFTDTVKSIFTTNNIKEVISTGVVLAAGQALRDSGNPIMSLILTVGYSGARIIAAAGTYHNANEENRGYAPVKDRQTSATVGKVGLFGGGFTAISAMVVQGIGNVHPVAAAVGAYAAPIASTIAEAGSHLFKSSFPQTAEEKEQSIALQPRV